MIHMYKIAVMGERNVIVAFSALGLDIFPVENEDEAKETFRSLTKATDKYAIIYLTETYYSALSEEIARFKESVTPAVILIPGAGGSSGIGRTALDSAVIRAIGADIL